MSVIQRMCTSVARPFSQLTSRTFCTLQQACTNQGTSHMNQKSVINSCANLISRGMASLQNMHKTGPIMKKRRVTSPELEGAPQKRGVVIKLMIKKPKKPNSANRKCVRVRLSNGREAAAYVPGEGHNLQEHSIVLVRGGRLRDTPGVKLKCVRGKFDLAHVKKRV